jgi:hypothetical protein
MLHGESNNEWEYFNQKRFFLKEMLTEISLSQL